MGRHMLQQGLSGRATHIKRVVEAIGEVDTRIILKSRIQLLQQILEGAALRSIIQVEILHQLPRCSLKAPNPIQNSFHLPIREFHLFVIDGIPLPPSSVVLRKTREKRDVRVLGRVRIQGGNCRRRCSRRWHSSERRSRQGQKTSR